MLLRLLGVIGFVAATTLAGGCCHCCSCTPCCSCDPCCCYKPADPSGLPIGAGPALQPAADSGPTAHLTNFQR